MESYIHPFVRVLMSTPLPQCICITGPTQSGKTTNLYNVASFYYSIPFTNLRSTTNPVFLIDAFTDIGESFSEFHVYTLSSFCRRRGTVIHLLLIDDIDLFPIQIQTQIYAFIQRYKNHMHIIFTCSQPTLLFQPLLTQGTVIRLSAIDAPEEKNGACIHKIRKTIKQSFALLRRVDHPSSIKNNTRVVYNMVEIWKTLYKEGILVADILVFIGEYILHDARSGASEWSDMQLFSLYECYTKFIHNRPSSEHLIELFFLASAFVSNPFCR